MSFKLYMPMGSINQFTVWIQNTYNRISMRWLFVPIKIIAVTRCNRKNFLTQNASEFVKSMKLHMQLQCSTLHNNNVFVRDSRRCQYSNSIRFCLPKEKRLIVSNSNKIVWHC